MLVRAAVTWAKGAPFALEALEIDEPRPDEILVQVHAVGMCHTDLIARDLYYPMPLPIVLGHEGADVVTKVGNQVTKVSPGDHVVLSYRSCGSCRSCLTARPGYCERIRDLTYQGTRHDGSTALRKDGQQVHSHFFGQSSFATYALSTERNTIKVPDDAPLELLAPLGCGVMTGMGAVLNSLRPPPGSSLAVYGTGSVGLSAVMAACLAGCHPIVAVDLHQTRRELALQLGATHAVNPQTDRVTEAVRDITAGGVDVALDTTGSPSVIRSAIDALASQGTCGLIAGSPEGTPTRGRHEPDSLRWPAHPRDHRRRRDSRRHDSQNDPVLARRHASIRPVDHLLFLERYQQGCSRLQRRRHCQSGASSELALPAPIHRRTASWRTFNRP